MEFSMKKYLLNESGNFYKANLHCHSNVSDGRKTPEEVKKIYVDKGYSVVAFTDHNVMISQDHLNDENFIVLHGFEVDLYDTSKHYEMYDAKVCHICFIALDPENMIQPFWHRAGYLFGNALNYRTQVQFDENEPNYIRAYGSEPISKMMREAREKGFFVTYNHPTWSLESYPDYMGYDGMHAFEMYNGSTLVAGYADYNPRIYDDMLMGGKKIYCIGADDNHNVHEVTSRRCDSGVAWTMIKAESLDYRTITKALEDGQFYASRGPEIYELSFNEGKVFIKCSEADKIVCNYGVRHAETALDDEGGTVTEATFSMKPEWRYFRITVTDKQGKTACTNAYFTEDLFD